MSKRKQYGYAAHFICGPFCLFHIATRVGRYLVSTVGDYRHPREYVGEKAGEMKEIGYGRFFETFVFDLKGGKKCSCGCGMPAPASWSEIDTLAAKTADVATANHERMCAKWEAP